jgi:hypothetical protein
MEKTDNMSDNIITINRLNTYLKSFEQEYPDCWKRLEIFINDDDFQWPSWCYCPIAGSYAVVSNGSQLDPSKIADVSFHAALAAWRLTKNIYNFDRSLSEALISTDLHELPMNIFYRIPEWCMYIKAENLFYEQKRIEGFFFHLEYDMNKSTTELRFVLDSGQSLFPLVLHMESTLVEALKESLKTSNSFLDPLKRIDLDVAHEKASIYAPFLSLVLYLCSENQDTIYDNKVIGAGNRFPKPKKCKQGNRFFAAEKPSFYEVGYKVGESLQYANSQKSYSSDNKNRPHIRRSHWHTFLTGKRTEERTPLLKWLPPILVNSSDFEELVPTIKNVGN